MLKMMWFRRKKYLLVQMFLHHFLSFSIFKIFHTWSSYVDFKITIYNTLCWYSGKDTGLSPGRPQFKSRHHQGFLQKDLPWKFFKKWLSIRRITVWITNRRQSFPCPGICKGRISHKSQSTVRVKREPYFHHSIEFGKNVPRIKKWLIWHPAYKSPLSFYFLHPPQKSVQA